MCVCVSVGVGDTQCACECVLETIDVINTQQCNYSLTQLMYVLWDPSIGDGKHFHDDVGSSAFISTTEGKGEELSD